MAKKSNVFLKTPYNYHAGEVKPCGHLQIGEMSEFFAQIKNAKIPSESCITAIYTSIASTALTMRGKNTQNNAEEFIIDLHGKESFLHAKEVSEALFSGNVASLTDKEIENFVKKYKQNSSFMKDTNKSTTLRNSFKHSTLFPFFWINV